MNSEVQIAKAITGAQLSGIHALWHLIDAGRGDDRDSRTARLEYCSAILARPVSSAKDLSIEEAQTVLKAMREEVGQEWKARGGGGRRAQALRHPKVSGAEQTKIGELAVDLWGERWNELLSARLLERFRVASPRSLTPSQARSIIEEMLARIAVRNIADRHQPPIPRAEIEAEKAGLRERYFGTKVGAEREFYAQPRPIQGGP